MEENVKKGGTDIFAIANIQVFLVPLVEMVSQIYNTKITKLNTIFLIPLVVEL